jgi:hypothetical protein
MDNYNELLQLFNSLTNDKMFILKEVIYDEKNFGNISVTLENSNGIRIQFLRDRGIGDVLIKNSYRFSEWLPLDIVYKILRISYPICGDEFFTMIACIYKSVGENTILLNQLNNKHLYKNIIREIKKIQLSKSKFL